jgi:spore maturation protein CgeB
MIKKIMYIGFKNEFGDKSNEAALNNKAFCQNFENLGYQVYPVWYDDFSHDKLQEEIINKANEIKPDIIFFILQLSQIEESTLTQLKNNNVFIVNWFGDDQWRFDDFSCYYANCFDVCITTDKFSVDKYLELGQINIIRSQWASLESLTNVEVEKYKYDVSFIGGVSPYRKWIVKELGKRGIKVDCFGDNWANGRVNWEQMSEIFRTSKININISNSTQYDIRYLLSNPKNILNTLRSKKNKSQTKARIFEIPVHGGFELTEYVPSLEDYFDIGKELICYTGLDEAELLIKYYLTHEKERENIRLSGINKARNMHTFKHRIKNFMQEIEKIKDLQTD